MKHCHCKISDTSESTKVYGVFNSWDGSPNDGYNDILVSALGSYPIRINSGITVAAGDLLVSAGNGCAKKQSGTTISNKTIGKVLNNTKVYEYDDGSYCVPCSVCCG